MIWAAGIAYLLIGLLFTGNASVQIKRGLIKGGLPVYLWTLLLWLPLLMVALGQVLGEAVAKAKRRPA